jgi:hypothetical protein
VTDYYVYSGAAGAADGSSWTDAYTNLAAAISGKSHSDRIFIANDHNHSYGAASQTLSFPSGAPSSGTCFQIICVDRAGSVPPVAADVTTGAVERCTSGSVTLRLEGHAYIEGVEFRTNDGGNDNGASLALLISANAPGALYFKNCILRHAGGTSNSGSIIFGVSHAQSRESLIVMDNTNVQFNSVNQTWTIGGRVIWKGGSLLGTAPTNMLRVRIGQHCHLTAYGVDLSLAGSGKNLSLVSTGANGLMEFINCKLGASVTPVSGSSNGPGGVRVDFVNCDDADTNHRFARHMWGGSIVQESTIVKSSGASDGTTALSFKAVSNSNAGIAFPLLAAEIFGWIDSTGSKTFTVEIVTDNVTLNDDEIWLEVEYLGTSGVPMSVIGNDRRATVLTTAAAQASSSVTWTTTGLGTPTKQKLEVTGTVNEKGPFVARVYLAKASTTVYIDPLVTVS